MILTSHFVRWYPQKKGNQQRISEATPKDPAPLGEMELNIQEIPDSFLMQLFIFSFMLTTPREAASSKNSQSAVSLLDNLRVMS